MSEDKTNESIPTKPAAIKYRKYDFKKRNRLIEMVTKQKKSLAPSAKELGIAQTTARLIMKTWNSEGRVFQKKVDRIKRQKREALKQSQTLKKEKQRLKKLARKQQPVTEAPEAQQPRNEIKVQQTGASIIQEQRTAILPQIPFEPAMACNPYGFFFIYPQAQHY